MYINIKLQCFDNCLGDNQNTEMLITLNIQWTHYNEFIVIIKMNLALWLTLIRFSVLHEILELL